MKYQWIVVTITGIGVLMSTIDSYAVIVALPAIGKDLVNTTFIDLVWIVLGYQLITGSVLINFGKLGDLFGRVRLYNLGFILFTVGSGISSISQTATQLIFFRIIQGTGAALITATSPAIIADAFPPEERGKALGMNQLFLVCGSLLGLVFGGFLTSVAGWRSIFWVNIPIGTFATLWSRYNLRSSQGPRRVDQKIDWAGNVLLAGALLSLLSGITLYAEGLVADAVSFLLLFFGVAGLGAFVYVEGRVRQPMFDLNLFKSRMFGAGVLAMFLNAVARGATSLILAFYLEGPSMGLTPILAGAFLLPMSFAIATIGPITGSLSDKYGSRLVPALGSLVTMVGFALMLNIGETISFEQLAVRLVVIGLGIGVFQVTTMTSIMNSVTSDVRGVASGTAITVQNIGGSFATAIAFFIIATKLTIQQARDFFAGTSTSQSLPIAKGLIDSMHELYLVNTLLLALAVAVYLLMARPSSSKHVAPLGAP